MYFNVFYFIYPGAAKKLGIVSFIMQELPKGQTQEEATTDNETE